MNAPEDSIYFLKDLFICKAELQKEGQRDRNCPSVSSLPKWPFCQAWPSQQPELHLDFLDGCICSSTWALFHRFPRHVREVDQCAAACTWTRAHIVCRGPGCGFFTCYNNTGLLHYLLSLTDRIPEKSTAPRNIKILSQDPFTHWKIEELQDASYGLPLLIFSMLKMKTSMLWEILFLKIYILCQLFYFQINMFLKDLFIYLEGRKRDLPIC